MTARAIGAGVTRRRLLLAIAVAALTWTSGIAVVPLVESFDHEIAATAAGLSRLAYRPVCHQIPERSLALDGRPFTVCARCAGLYLGGALALLLVAVGRDRRRPPGRAWLVVAVVPTALDFGIHLLTGVGLPNLPRLVVALPAGLMLGWYLADALADLAKSAVGRRDPAGPRGPIANPDRLQVGG